MKIQKLSWAGIKIQSKDTTILVDAVENFAITERFVMQFEEPVFSFTPYTKADIIVLTHLHLDHFDAKVLRQCLQPSGTILCSSLFYQRLVADGFTNLVVLELGQVFSYKHLRFIPVFAMDGIGDDQVSWIIETDEHRILHGGDTIWHNQFWKIAKRFPGFDAVFLPTNGAVVRFSFLPYSPVPASLTPRDAVSAARLLTAKQLVPIHYGFHSAGIYEQFPDMKEHLIQEAATANQSIHFLKPGEWIEL